MKMKTMYIPVTAEQRYHIERRYLLWKFNVFLVLLSITIYF